MYIIVSATGKFSLTFSNFIAIFSTKGGATFLKHISPPSIHFYKGALRLFRYPLGYLKGALHLFWEYKRREDIHVVNCAQPSNLIGDLFVFKNQDPNPKTF